MRCTSLVHKRACACASAETQQYDGPTKNLTNATIAMYLQKVANTMAEVYKKAPEAFPGNPMEEIKNRIYISPFYEEGIDDLINLVGVDQVLYGSDWPHPEGLAEPTHYVTALEHLSVDDQAKIMGGNLGRLVTV